MNICYLLIATLAISALIAMGGTYLARSAANNLHWLDKPSPRKSHAKSIPLLGGLAIYGSFLASLLIFYRPWLLSEGLSLIIGATLIAGVGLYDDLQGLNPLPKLLGQIVAAFAIILSGLMVDISGIYWLDIAITMFWIVGICNAMNLLDNMDGVSAGVAAIACLFFGAIGLHQGQIGVAIVSAALSGATLGFLRFNWHPATIFMGDAGSLLLGFILAALGLMVGFPTNLEHSAIMPIFILAIPIFDTTLVTISRLRRGLRITDGGKDHTSHRLVKLGLSIRKTAATIYLAALLCGAGSLLATLLPFAGIKYAIGAIITLSAILGLFLLEKVDLSNTGQTGCGTASIAHHRQAVGWAPPTTDNI
ncbi:MAG: MraY family glycosyltransferase [Hormoscilla sp.]